MKIVERVRRKLFPVANKTLIYDEALQKAYQSASVMGAHPKGMKVLIIHDGGPLHQSLIDRLAIEDVVSNDINVNDNEPKIHQDIDSVIVVFEWTPEKEMMRLKSITKDTYNDFWGKFADKTLDIVHDVVSSSKVRRVITLLPAFSVTEKFGYTLYGIVANHIISSIDDIANSYPDIKCCHLQYAKTLKAQPSVKPNIVNKEGSLHHILLREQVTAVVVKLLSDESLSVVNRTLQIGVGDCANMSEPIINKKIYGLIEGSSCGGALADSNILIVYDDHNIFKELKTRFDKENAYVYGLAIDTELSGESLEEAKRKMTGLVDVIINILNMSSLDSSVTQVYRWFQVESPFLTSQERQATICSLFVHGKGIGKNSNAKIKSLTTALARLLGNHSFVVNSVIANDTTDITYLSDKVSFLCSKYGEALTGETIIMK